MTVGLCQCGCGQPTRPSQRNNARLGYVKGQPMRFVVGHRDVIGRIPKPIEDFYEVVDHGHDTPCWIWSGALHGSNERYRYGCIRRGKRLYPAHRFIYEQLRGPIPAGLVLDHLCRVTQCVNPDHVEPVTQRENMRRGALGAQWQITA